MSEPNGMSRRSLFQLVGLTSLGAVGVGAAGSGCAPAQPKAGGRGNSSGGGSATGGEFHAGTLYLPAPQGNYNCAGQPFVKVPNAILFAGNYGDLVMLPSAFYHWKEQTWDLYLLDSYKLDNATNTYTVAIKSGLTWSDGTPITAKDYLTTFWCQWVLGSPLWDYIDKIAAPDDHTFTMKMNQPAPVVERYLLHSNIIPSSQYGDIATQAAAAARSGGLSKAPAALSSKLLDLQPKAYIASGPFNIDYKTMNNTQLTLIKNPKGYAADRVNFDKIVIYNGETPAITPLMLTKSIDYATNGFPVASAKQFESLGYEILKPPTYSGPALFLNYGKHPEFNDARVRQALNYAINHDQNGAAALGPSGKPTKYYTGFSDFLADAWIDPSAKSKLNSYTYSADKATALLESAGWKRQGNAWRLPNGKPAAYELLFPSDYADWSGAAKDLSDQFGRFGIPITLRGVVSTQQPSNIYKSQFDLAIQSWGNSSQPYPYFSFVAAFLNYNYPMAQSNGGKGMNYPLKRKVQGFGQVDLQKLISATGSGTDQKTLVANTTRLAEIFNVDLPIIPLFERLGNSPALDGVRVKNFPTNDDPLITNSLYADNVVILSMLSGRLEPVAK
ncbi:MAG: ABC transporter substrate-binding protein [Microlunatus sp.]|nr:ABC transporter substrate-binding protein [Microlunatus sp.]